MELESLLGPVVQAEGLELYDVTRGRDGGRKVLTVVVDRPGGVDVDTLSRLSERVSRILDDEDAEAGPYELQVTSPGLERSLRRPEHFRRAVGLRVKVKTTAPMAGSRTHTGTMTAADDEAVTVLVEGEPRRIAHANIASARTVVDWGAELKRSNA